MREGGCSGRGHRTFLSEQEHGLYTWLLVPLSPFVTSGQPFSLWASNSRSAACAIGLNPGKHPCSERCRHFGCSAHGSSLALPEVPLVQIATPHWVPPGAHTLQRGTQAALLWPRPRPKALGTGALFIEVDQQKLHPTRDQNHPHCGAKRVPQFAPGRRRQAALIALIPTL